MPKPTAIEKGFLGIDPGAEGALSLYFPDRDSNRFETLRLDKYTLEQTWTWLLLRNNRIKLAVIEQQTMRPTRFFNAKAKPPRWESTVLASTGILYGSYTQLTGLLIAAGISTEDCPPKRWQKGLGIPDRAPKETSVEWKRRIRVRAEKLFPREAIIACTAEAMLLAAFAHRRFSSL